MKLKEEVALRLNLRGGYYPDSIPAQKKVLSRLIADLVRAVRADEREKAINKATTYLHGTYYQHVSEELLLREIAAAIREGK